jgi:hypothetical protein
MVNGLCDALTCPLYSFHGYLHEVRSISYEKLINGALRFVYWRQPGRIHGFQCFIVFPVVSESSFGVSLIKQLS